MPDLVGRYEILPTRLVLHGPGSLAELPAVLQEAGIERIHVLTGPSVGRTRFVADLLARCGQRVVGVFAQARADNPVGVALQAAESVRASGADGIVTVGGGALTDLGKAVRLILRRGVRRADDLWPLATVKGRVVRQTLRPTVESAAPVHIAVPTTLSGAEFGHSCAITDDAAQVKRLFIYPENAADMVLLDPVASAETPAEIWAATGIKAMDHAVEQIYATTATPFTAPTCLDGLRRLHASLPRASEAGARRESMEATWLICFGMMNAMKGLSHGLGHQIGPRWGVPHGLTSCVTLTHVLRFNRDWCLPQQRRMAEALGLPVAKLSDHAAAEALAAELERLIRRLGLPTRLKAVGGRKEDFPAIARAALADPVTIANPRPLEVEAEIEALLEDAW